MSGQAVTRLDAARPVVPVGIKTHLIRFRRIDAFEPDFRGSYNNCVTVHNARYARNDVGSLRFERKH